MDLDEWEYLPDDGFLDFHEEKEEKRIFSSKAYSDSKSVFNMNYFIIPSPNSRKLIETPPQGFINSRVPNQLVPVPIQLELPPSFVKASEVEEEEVVDKFPIDEKTNYKAKALEADDQDTQLSQVHFKKTWENEFADMKMDSPKSPTCRSPRFMQHQTTDAAAAAASIESKITSPRIKICEKNNNLFDSEDTKEEEKEEKEEGDDDLVKSGRDHNSNNIWKLSLTGIGAICSFGFAAATICVVFFGTHQRNKQYQQNQNRFQIYTDDNKRIKQATKFNEAFSAVRGVPITRAHVTFGGYYNGL